MREIKFRAWDIFRKVMLSNSDIWFKTDVKGYELFCDTPDNRDSLQLMQYTGLKDKNGVEIYEGDYINIFYENDKMYGHGLISYIRGGFQCYDMIMQDIYNENLYCEVIGNIYENKELLDAK